MDGIEQAACNLKELVHKTANRKKLRTAKTRSSWWYEDIEKQDILEQKAQKILRDIPSIENLAEFKSISIQLKSAAVKARRTHFKQLCKKMDKPWQLHSLMSKKCKCDAAIILLDQNGEHPAALFQ